MGFDKNYPNRKDRRKRYRGSKSFDLQCRPHGGCEWCKGSRLIRMRRELIRTNINVGLEEYEQEQLDKEVR